VRAYVLGSGWRGRVGCSPRRGLAFYNHAHQAPTTSPALPARHPRAGAWELSSTRIRGRLAALPSVGVGPARERPLSFPRSPRPPARMHPRVDRP
jgi:hypothetical protein